jgi:hypothetical protein
MSLTFTDDAATADGASTVEDVLPLLEYLQAHANAGVDLGPCTHLHTAVLQVLMAARPRIVAMPGEAFLARWLPAALNQPNRDAERL